MPFAKLPESEGIRATKALLERVCAELTQSRWGGSRFSSSRLRLAKRAGPDRAIVYLLRRQAS